MVKQFVEQYVVARVGRNERSDLRRMVFLRQAAFCWAIRYQDMAGKRRCAEKLILGEHKIWLPRMVVI